MPNYCSNSLEIKGKRRDLLALKKKLDGSNGCFTCGNIIPRLKDMCINKDTLSWSDLWGSKWDVMEASLKDFGDRSNAVDFIKDDDWLDEFDSLHYVYQTAWSPVNKVVERLSDMFRDCYFIHEFEEGGNGFHGLEEYLGGVMIRELNLPMTEYDDDSGDILNLKELEDIANGFGGYFDYYLEIFRERGFEKHKHKYF